MNNGIPTPPYDEQSQKLIQQQQQQQQSQQPRPVSRKSSNSTSSPPASVPSSRAAKSGSGNHATASHTSVTATHQHHHNSHRASKRSGSTPTATHSHSHSHHTASTASHNTGASAAAAAAAAAHSHGSPHHDNDGRHKRVWKACERCRMKKTKCDGEFPCKRCKDDGLICTAGTRKKTEYKQVPKGYAEVLEHTQFALVATVHKLYKMVVDANAWDLGEPEKNERGQPVIHSIASQLGCIRPNNDPDLPLSSSFIPEDEKDCAAVITMLEERNSKREAEQAMADATAATTAAAQIKSEPNETTTTSSKTTSTTATTATALPITMSSSMPASTGILASNSAIDFNLSGRFDRASSSEDYDGFSDMDDYRKNVFGSGNNSSSVNSASTTMSPQSLNFTDFDVGSNQSDGFAAPSPTMPTTQYTNWMTQTAPVDTPAQQPRQSQQMAQLQQFQQQQQAQQLHKHQQQLLQQQQRQLQRQQQLQQQNFKQAPPSLAIPTTMATSSVPMIGGSPFYTTEMLRQGMLENNFGTMQPHVIDTPELVLGMGDPMIYTGDYDDNLF
ncbi:Fluconazole resistance protein 1 [Sporothrix stenoceras]|uniref:Fluconazole resistance protein 1 n=1 Tax=Sporothrix stenoceras TaxID=5173 RepID=A0ABR3Z1B0_9PEZI